MTTSDGPSDPSLWLTRPLGHWERQLVVDWPAGVPGPSRCTINNVTLIKTIQDIDVDKWEAGVRNVVFREPNLRTDVDLKSDPVSWTPATDFSQVYFFRDVLWMMFGVLWRRKQTGLGNMYLVNHCSGVFFYNCQEEDM